MGMKTSWFISLTTPVSFHWKVPLTLRVFTCSVQCTVVARTVCTYMQFNMIKSYCTVCTRAFALPPLSWLWLVTCSCAGRLSMNDPIASMFKLVGARWHGTIKLQQVQRVAQVEKSHNLCSIRWKTLGLGLKLIIFSLLITYCWHMNSDYTLHNMHFVVYTVNRAVYILYNVLIPIIICVYKLIDCLY